MPKTDIHPKVLVADLWDNGRDLGAALDAFFSSSERNMAGIILGYYTASEEIIISGPAQIATRARGQITISESLPEESDALAARSGRAIQALMSAAHIPDFLENLHDSMPLWDGPGYTSGLFTPNGAFFFRDDPWDVIENRSLETDPDTASMQICTMVLRPAHSAHGKLARAKGMLRDFDIYLAFQENGLSVMEAQGIARICPPRAEKLAALL